MPNYSEIFAQTDSQFDEMEKIAVTGLASKLWQAGPWAGRLLGAGGGAATGAGIGYATGETPEEQKSRALKGALVGGIGGLIPGQLLTQKGLSQAKQFGQRQAHGVTGYLPGRGILGKKTEGLPTLTQAQRTKELKAIGWKIPEKKTLEQAVSEKKGPLKEFRAKRQLAAEKAQRELVEEGLTSIPGLAKGYLRGTDGLTRAQVLKANLLAPGVALGLGAPAVMAAPDLAESIRQRDPKRAARTLAETAGYSLAGGLPIGAAMGVGTGVSALAGRLLGSSQSAAPGAAQSTVGKVLQQGELPNVRYRR
jgi:hypothetical protein